MPGTNGNQREPLQNLHQRSVIVAVFPHHPGAAWGLACLPACLTMQRAPLGLALVLTPPPSTAPSARVSLQSRPAAPSTPCLTFFAFSPPSETDFNHALRASPPLTSSRFSSTSLSPLPRPASAAPPRLAGGRAGRRGPHSTRPTATAAFERSGQSIHPTRTKESGPVYVLLPSSGSG